MSQRMRTISIPHLHKLHHKQPSVRDKYSLVASNLCSAIVHLTLEQASYMRWGMQIQIEDIMHKVEINRLRWNRVVLDMKEFQLALDEIEFERQAGEITWDTATGEYLPTDSEHEDVIEGEASQEKVEAGKSKKEPAVTEASCTTRLCVDCDEIVKHQLISQEESIADARIEARYQKAIRDVNDTRKYLKLENWSDDEVKKLQAWLILPEADRLTAQKAMDLAEATNCQVRSSVTEEPLKDIVVDEDRLLREKIETRHQKQKIDRQCRVDTDKAFSPVVDPSPPVPPSCLITPQKLVVTKKIRVDINIGVGHSPKNVCQPPRSSEVTHSFNGLHTVDGLSLLSKVSATEGFRELSKEEIAAEIELDVECFRKSLWARKMRIAKEAEAQNTKRLPKNTIEKFEEYTLEFEAEIEKRTKQYRDTLVEGRKWENGPIGLEGLGPEKQQHLFFNQCDDAEKVRRAQLARKHREAYQLSIEATGAENGAWTFDPEEEAELEAYERLEWDMDLEYRAGIAAGYNQGVAKRAAHAKLIKRQAPINDGFEEKIRKAEKAREERARALAERKQTKEAAAAVAEETAGGQTKKSQKKGKPRGRKNKK